MCELRGRDTNMGLRVTCRMEGRTKEEKKKRRGRGRRGGDRERSN